MQRFAFGGTRAGTTVETLERVAIEVMPLENFADESEGTFGGDALHANPHSVSGGCTTGFTVEKPSTGQRGLVTAGHCNWTLPGGGSPGTGNAVITHYHHPWSGTTETHSTSTLTIQGSHEGTGGDHMWFTPTTWVSQGGFYVKPNTRRWATGHRPIAQINVGDHVCVFGRSTNSPSILCDQVLDTYFIKSTGGISISGLVVVDANLTQGGDSGGPWFNWKTAIGIHHGKAGNTHACPTCSAFTPVDLALIYYSLDLLTA